MLCCDKPTVDTETDVVIDVETEDYVPESEDEKTDWCEEFDDKIEDKAEKVQQLGKNMADAGKALGGKANWKKYGEKLTKRGKTLQKIPVNLEDIVEKGSEKLFKSLYGFKGPAGLGAMVWAHIDAPMKASAGDGKGAVDSACTGVGALAGGVLGGPVGAVVGAAMAWVPGQVINYFDTSSTQFSIIITNYTDWNLYFAPSLINGSSGSPEPVGYGPTLYDACFFPCDCDNMTVNSACGKMIPAAKEFLDQDDKHRVSAWSFPWSIKSKAVEIGFRLEARETLGRHELDVPFSFLGSVHEDRIKWWEDETNVKHCWACGISAPPAGSWTGSHYVSISSWAGTGNERATHKAAVDNLKPQKDLGPENGHKSKNDSKGESCIYWKTWNQCVIELYE